MKWIVTLSIPILLSQLALSEPAAANCTIGVAGGAVTHDGRSLLWKSRMTGLKPDHEVVYSFSVPYRYIGVRGGGAYYPQMGVNSAGLSTGNSQVGPDDSGDGPFTEHVLRNFATVDEVRDYIVVPEKALILFPAWRSRAIRGAAVGSDLVPGYQTARSSGM